MSVDEITATPQGWEDSRIEAEIHQLLRPQYRVPIGNLRATVQGGHVTLRGEAFTYEVKQAATDVVEGIPGVTKVDNQIRVKPLG